MDILTNNMTVILILTINLAASLSYLVIISKDSFKKKYFSLPVVFQKMYVFFFVAPLLVAPFMRQSVFYGNKTMQYVSGFLLSLTGLIFIASAFLKIGAVPAIKKKSGLSSTGAYAMVRHPIY